MRTISITQALNELKLYDSKINKSLNTAFVGTAKKSSAKINAVDKDDFAKRAKSDYQSIVDLISNRNKLKSAIVKSNADTIVEINGKKMSRAEAIERKTSIIYDRSLLTTLQSQYVSATSKMNEENRKVDTAVQMLLNSLVGKDSNKAITEESQNAIEKPYRENNEFELVDPLNIYEKVQMLQDDISGFEANVDTVLAISNATTFVELDF